MPNQKKCSICGNPCRWYRCKNCRKDYEKKRYQELKDSPEYKKRAKERSKKWYATNRERVIQKTTARAIEKRTFAIGKYGGKCVCCGEKNQKFLTFDHRDNNGAKHRRDIGTVSSRHFVEWIIKNNFPEDIQVLCYNCNCGKAYNNGICPHKKK